MVSCGAHCAHAVVPRWQTTGHDCLETSIAIALVVDTLEKRKGRWIGRGDRSEGITQALHCDVSVTDNTAAA
jgi:rRNA processing protein Krr1/Pno1